MLDLLTGDLATALGGLVVAVMGALGLYLKGRSDAKNKAEAKKAKDYIDTRKRIDEVDSDPLPDDIRKRLRERGKR